VFILRPSTNSGSDCDVCVRSITACEMPGEKTTRRPDHGANTPMPAIDVRKSAEREVEKPHGQSSDRRTRRR
jgi:hypothetical protein